MAHNRLITYPATQAEFESAIDHLPNASLYYRKQFFLTLPPIIHSPKSPVSGYCELHRLHFTTNGRYLLSRSRHLNPHTCPQCDYVHGYRGSEPWTLFRIEELLYINQSTWVINRENKSDNLQLSMSDTVELRCINTLDDGTPCVGPNGKPTCHTVRNIGELRNNPSHIMCQGRCDQRKKGKRSRLGETEMQAILSARESQWMIIPCGAKTKADLYTVECSICTTQIILTGHSLRIKDPNCPLCHLSPGQLTLANPTRDAPRLMKAITGGALSLGDPTIDQFPSRLSVAVKCASCQTEFRRTIPEIRRSVCYGCPSCSTDREESTNRKRLKRWADIAERGGLFLLTKKWVNAETPLDLECTACGHRFVRAPEKLTVSTSCPDCSSRIGEYALRKILSALFGTPFKHYTVCIDGARRVYDAAPTPPSPLFVLAEYHGSHHHNKGHPLWAGRLQDYERQERSDRDKIKWANHPDNMIPLLIVWHEEFFKIRTEDRVDFVRQNLARLGVAGMKENAWVDWEEIFRRSKGAKAVHEIAKSRGGKVLSGISTYQEYALFKCAVQQHREFALSPARILYQNAWCPVCTGRNQRVYHAVRGYAGTW